MLNTRTYRALAAILIGLFASLQVFTAAHAVCHGDAPHDHDGVECVITVIAAEDHIVLPVLSGTPQAIVISETPSTALFTSALYLAPQGRAPPPRGPPFFIH